MPQDNEYEYDEYERPPQTNYAQSRSNAARAQPAAQPPAAAQPAAPEEDVELADLLAQQAALTERIAARRAAQQQAPPPAEADQLAARQRELAQKHWDAFQAAVQRAGQLERAAAQARFRQRRPREDDDRANPAAQQRRLEEPESIPRHETKRIEEEWEVIGRHCVRATADTRSERLAMLQDGQWCKATEQCGDQMKVNFKTNDGSAVVGWMTKDTECLKEKNHRGLVAQVVGGVGSVVASVLGAGFSAVMQGDASEAQHQVMRSNGLYTGKRLTAPDVGTSDGHTFTVGKFLGSGTFAVVVTGNGPHGVPVALKVSKTDDSKHSRIEAEILTLQLKGKRGVVKCFQHFDCESRHIIVLEEYGLDLHTFARKQEHRKLSQEMAARVLHDLAGALSYVHKEKLVHTDIKLANLLLKKDTDTITSDPNSSAVVLCDFGSCARPCDARELAFGRPYRAPEVVYYETKGWGSPADIFAAGCVMVELVTDVDEQLFASKRNKDHMNQLKTWREKIMHAGVWPNDEYNLEKIPVSVDCDFQARDVSDVHCKAGQLSIFSGMRRMVFEMMNMYPHNRPSAEALMDHPDMISLWPGARTATAKYT